MPRPDPNFTIHRHLLCAILEQAVDDWRCLQRAGRIPAPATGLTTKAIMQGKSEVRDMNNKEISSLLRLLTTTELDQFCTHLNATINPDGVRRALGIPRPKLLDFITVGHRGPTPDQAERNAP
ncbi:MAG: hypothetical protein NTY53_06095 [Kiritimatiellaeota bacterium]|nr:hypothetical protein [Kiritimatiellota bacterium]